MLRRELMNDLYTLVVRGTGSFVMQRGQVPQKVHLYVSKFAVETNRDRPLAYCAKHLLRTYCDLESRRNCSIIVTVDEKQLASI